MKLSNIIALVLSLSAIARPLELPEQSKSGLIRRMPTEPSRGGSTARFTRPTKRGDLTRRSSGGGPSSDTNPSSIHPSNLNSFGYPRSNTKSFTQIFELNVAIRKLDGLIPHYINLLYERDAADGPLGPVEASIAQLREEDAERDAPRVPNDRLQQLLDKRKPLLKTRDAVLSDLAKVGKEMRRQLDQIFAVVAPDPPEVEEGQEAPGPKVEEGRDNPGGSRSRAKNLRSLYQSFMSARTKAS